MAVSPSMDLGVQSFCFRNFKDNAQVAQFVRQIGVDKIELCGIHADFNDPKAFEKVVKIYESAGVKVVSIGVQTVDANEAVERKWLECCKIAGARHMGIHYKVSNFAQAAVVVSRLAEEYDMHIGIHCHGGYMFGGQPDVLKHLLSLGSERIGVQLDTAWCMQIGPFGDPVDWVLNKFKGRITSVHYKDFVFNRRGKWEDVVVGKGNLDLPALVKALDQTGFTGPAIIEYEAEPENPVPALTNCVKEMRAVGQ